MLGCIAAVATLTDGYVYQWLLALVTFLSLVAVLVAVHPAATWFRAILSWTPLVEIGKRSYGIYLWHWPIFVFADAYGGSVSRVVAALALTAVVSELCYRFVEMPVRRGELGRWWRTARSDGSCRSPGRPWSSPVWSPSTPRSIRSTGPPGGEDVTFGATGDGAGQPTTTAAGANAAPTTTAAAQGPRRVVVVGDSQAHALAINLPDGIDDTFDVTDGSVEGCSVYDEGTLETERDGYTLSFGRCRRLAGRVGGGRRSGGRRRRPRRPRVPGTCSTSSSTTAPTSSSVRRSGTPTSPKACNRASTRSNATGARVALLEVPCMRPQDVEGDGVPALPERGDDDRVAHLNDLWRGVAEANPETVTFVSGPTEWCDDESVSSDVGYRWDGVHVYTPGPISSTRRSPRHSSRSEGQPNARHSVPDRGDARADRSRVRRRRPERCGVEGCRVELQLADGVVSPVVPTAPPPEGWRRPPG